MLKSLKDKKKNQNQPQKQAEKKPITKKPIEKPTEDEQDEDVGLVDIDYNQKNQTIVKVVRLTNEYKLDERAIDVSNIPVEKKQEKKVIKSWIVEQADVAKILTKDFKMNEHQNDFESLTNQNINEEIKQKKKKQRQAALVQSLKASQQTQINSQPKTYASGNMASKDLDLVFSKKSNIQLGIPVTEPTKMFKNTNLTGNPNFKLIEKTVQQLKEEEIEQKIKARTEQDAQKSWMGTIKDKQPEFPVKQSAWVTMGMGETTTADPTTDEILPKMARITKSPQQLKMEKMSNRQEKQFKYTTKKLTQQRNFARKEKREFRE